MVLHGRQISGLHVGLVDVGVGKVGVGWAIGQRLQLCGVHCVCDEWDSVRVWLRVYWRYEESTSIEDAQEGSLEREKQWFCRLRSDVDRIRKKKRVVGADERGKMRF